MKKKTLDISANRLPFFVFRGLHIFLLTQRFLSIGNRRENFWLIEVFATRALNTLNGGVENKRSITSPRWRTIGLIVISLESLTSFLPLLLFYVQSTYKVNMTYFSSRLRAERSTRASKIFFNALLTDEKYWSSSCTDFAKSFNGSIFHHEVSLKKYSRFPLRIKFSFVNKLQCKLWKWKETGKIK